LRARSRPFEIRHRRFVGGESERGPAYARYLRAVADNPDFVGAHWFQYLDEPLTGRTLDGENAHIGFVTVADLWPHERPTWQCCVS
jgi:hypothetical protein